jgi:hypothetical protein
LIVGFEVEFAGLALDCGRLGVDAGLACGGLLAGLFIELAFAGLDVEGLAPPPPAEAALMRCALAKSGRLTNTKKAKENIKLILLSK